jgi:formylglycine-generating enzyme required for sulfatase activity/predicted Ser/Thr protein kinase
MSEFPDALKSFRDGRLSREDLLWDLERRLETGESQAGALLGILEEEPIRKSLPRSLHAALTRKIRRWEAQAQFEADYDRARGQIGQATGSTPVESPTVTMTLSELDLPFDAQESAEGPRRHTPAAVGSVLVGRFKLTELIAAGGMGAVYKAIDLRKVETSSPDCHVAVKLLTLPLQDFTRSLALLQGEAHKLQRLPHPSIVRVIDCDRDGTTVFMTMEYLAGESLKSRLGKRFTAGGPADEVKRIIEAVSSALAFAHRNGIVHGDLKPDNVIVTDGGEIKVIDFGIARLVPTTTGNTTLEGERREVNGLTPRYASPEMLEGQQPDPRDDLYALACIAYELSTGRHPFADRSATLAREAGMKPVHHPSLSREQFKAIAHGLEFERAERTPSAEVFLQEFTEPRRVSTSTRVALGAVLVALLCASYFLFRAPVDRWIEGRAVGVTPAPNQVFRDCPTCPLMKALAPGRFQQGTRVDEPEATALEQPEHAVSIAYPFGIGVNEVTVAEFKEFIDATARRISGCEVYDGSWQERADRSWDGVGYSQTESHPVVCVSWRDASDYAQWLSQKTGRHYRLPSASEWEYAARGGSVAQSPWASNPATACSYANVADRTAQSEYPGWKVQPCGDGYVHSAPVGSFAANAFGLHDMLGNVSEWVQDCWHDNYTNAPTNGSAWAGGDCTRRETRGGSWFTDPAYVRVGARNRFEESRRSSSVGFRLVREISR